MSLLLYLWYISGVVSLVRYPIRLISFPEFCFEALFLEKISFNEHMPNVSQGEICKNYFVTFKYRK